MGRDSFFAIKLMLSTFFIVIASQLFSQNSHPVSGYVRASVYGIGEAYDFTTIFGEASFKGNFLIGNAFLNTDIRARSGVRFGERFSDFELKEAFAGYSNGKISVSLGNQIVSWGSSDLLSPSDKISPADRFFLSCNPDDQKLPNFMLRFSSRIAEGISGELILIPVYRESDYRFDLYNLGDGISFEKPSLPEKKIRNGTLALRVNMALKDVDLSLSFLRGYDPEYGFRMLSFEPGQSENSFLIRNSATPYLKKSIGADIVIIANSVIFKGEALLNLTKDFEDQIHIPYPSLECVAGFETTLLSTTISAEYSCKRTIGFREQTLPRLPSSENPADQVNFASQMAGYEFEALNRKIFHLQKRYNHSAAVSLSGYFLNDELEANLTGICNFTSSEKLIRGSIKWRFTDNLSATAGFNYLSGPEKTPFYYTKGIINGVFTELKFSF